MESAESQVPNKIGLEKGAPAKHRIRITLTSSNVPGLESSCQELAKSGRAKNVIVQGPVRLPTKTLRVTTRKTPCGEGSKTWDRFELRIHKRILDFITSQEMIKQIASIQIASGVDVEITMANA